MFRPSIRQKAFAVAAVAALALAPTYSFGQDIKPTSVASSSEGITATTNCKEWQPGVLMASEKCEILKGEFLKAQGNALDAQGKSLDAQGKQLGAQNACIQELVKFKNAAPDQFRSMAFGTITRDNACTFANRLPKKAASLQ